MGGEGGEGRRYIRTAGRIRRDRIGLDRIGLKIGFGLDWIGLNWIWIGLDWIMDKGLDSVTADNLRGPR